VRLRKAYKTKSQKYKGKNDNNSETLKQETRRKGDAVQWRTQGILFGGGGATNSVEDRGQRERGSGGGSGGSCNLVQEISFHIVKFS